MSEKYYYTVYIERSGTIYTDFDKFGNVEKQHPSLPGHMWYSVQKGNETPKDFGFQTSGIVTNDREAYAGTPAVAIKREITAEQYDNLIEFGNKENEYFQNGSYNLMTNSCVTFVYDGAIFAGVMGEGSQGSSNPIENIDNLQKNLNNGDGTYEEEFTDGRGKNVDKSYYADVIDMAINQIGSLIVANNENFSNIEKITVGTAVSTIADFATYKYNGEGDFNLGKEGLENLQNAVVSFALTSYFSKNDNIADILGMDGTFVGGLVDSTVSYTLGYYGSQAITDLFAYVKAVNNIDYKNNKIFKKVG
ncbi:hypothetical protein ACNSOO_10915 [Aliarcobacter lanthieri]|uniref:hypothetical protein n=1 Tax=Aliarcobacter lanthieri TaxID=1355374 RepID=UPI003AAC2F8B